MIVQNYNHFKEIITALKEGGLTENPKIEIGCNAAWDSQDFSLLEELLNIYPGIYEQALRNIDEINYWEEREPFRPHVNKDEALNISGQFHLGGTNGFPVGLNPLDFTRGLYICGETGSGKSYPVLRLIKQILSIPIEKRGFNLLIIQAVKRDVDFLFRDYSNLRIFELNNFIRAPFQREEWEDLSKKINSFCGVFSSTNWLMAHGQPLFKRSVKNAFRKNSLENGFYITPNFSDILNEVDNAAKDMGLDSYEHKTVKDKIKFILDPFIDSKFFNGRAGITIQETISQEDIVINLMDEDSDYVVGTIVTDLLIDLQRYYETNPIYPPILRTLVVIDESRRIMPRKYGKEDHNPHSYMERFVTTRRSSGIGLITITQEPQSSPSWLTNNSAFVLSFPIGGEARDHVKQLLNLSNEQSVFMDELPQRGTAIFRDRRFDRRYLLEVPGDLEVLPITPKETEQIMRPYIQKMKNALDKKEEAIKKIKSQVSPAKSYTKKELGKIRQIIYPDTLRIMKILQKDPFVNKTELLKKSGVQRNKFLASINWMETTGFIVEKSCRASKTKNASFFPLTEKGHDFLNTPNSKRKPNPERFTHTYYCFRVAHHLKSQGHYPIREYGPKNEPVFSKTTEAGKMVNILKRIDVYAEIDGQKIGYEITNSFSNLHANIFKCLVLMKMAQVVIVCENQNRAVEAKALVEKINIPEDKKEKIKFVQIGEFL